MRAQLLPRAHAPPPAPPLPSPFLTSDRPTALRARPYALSRIRFLKIVKYLDRFKFANFTRIVRLFCELLLVCHWIGCFWYAIGNNTTTPCEAFPGYFDPQADDVMVTDELGEGIWLGPNSALVNETGRMSAFCSWLSSNRLASADWESKCAGDECRPGALISPLALASGPPHTDHERSRRAATPRSEQLPRLASHITAYCRPGLHSSLLLASHITAYCRVQASTSSPSTGP